MLKELWDYDQKDSGITMLAIDAEDMLSYFKK